MVWWLLAFEGRNAELAVGFPSDRILCGPRRTFTVKVALTGICLYQVCLTSVLLEEAGHEAVPPLHNNLQLEAGLSHLNTKLALFKSFPALFKYY